MYYARIADANAHKNLETNTEYQKCYAQITSAFGDCISHCSAFECTSFCIDQFNQSHLECPCQVNNTFFGN